MLDAVVEDAVNAVGVDLNTASASLLARVSGLGASLAEAIVAHSDQAGAFKTRRELLDVSRLGPQTFERSEEGRVGKAWVSVDLGGRRLMQKKITTSSIRQKHNHKP